MDILEEERLPVVEFPQSSSRMTPATTRFYEAVMNKTLSHDGDKAMARHIANAQLRTDNRGSRLAKEKPGSTRRIDLAVAAVMAHERAVWHQSQGKALPPVYDPWNED
jgi:phage terminase large subunit-like protein